MDTPFNEGIVTTDPSIIEQDEPQYNLPVDEPSPLAPRILPEDLDNTARKYKFAIGDRGELSLEDVKFKLNSGQESQLRESFAYSKMLEDENARNKLVLEEARKGTDPQILKEIATTKSEYNPDTVIEKELSSQFTNLLTAMMPASLSQVNDPDALDKVLGTYEQNLTNRELFGRLRNEYAERIKDQTEWLGVTKNTDFIEQVIPFVSWKNFRNVASAIDSPTQFWKGNNISEIVSRLYTMPPEKAYAEGKKMVDQLMETNVYDAATLLSALQVYGSDEKFWANLETGLDIAGAPYKTIGKALGLAAVTGVIGYKVILPSRLASATGDLGTAGRLKILENLREQAKVVGGETSQKRLLDAVDTIADPAKVLDPKGTHFSQGFADKLVQSMNQSTETLLGKFVQAVNVKRLEPESQALKVALDEAEEIVKSQYQHVSDAILGTRYLDADATRANIPAVELAIGKKGVQKKKTFVPANNKFNFERGLEDSIGEIQGPPAFKAQIGASRKDLDRAYEELTRKKNALLSETKAERTVMAKAIDEETDFTSFTDLKLQYIKIIEDAKAGSDIAKAHIKKLGDDPLFVEMVARVSDVGLAETKYKQVGLRYEADVNKLKKLQAEEVESDLIIGNNRGIPYIKLPLENSIPVEINLGTPASLLFGSEKQAFNHAKNIYLLKDASYSIKQHGEGYYISVIKTVDESTPAVRAALEIDTRGSSPTNTIWNALARKSGSIEEIADKTITAARKVATYGGSDLLNGATQIVRDKLTQPLRKAERRRLEQFTTAQRDFIKGDEVGKFSENLSEFIADWYQAFGVRPTEREATAYFHYKQLSDFDWVARNIVEYSNQARAGYEMVSFDTKGWKFKQPVLEGKLVKNIPEYKDHPATIVKWSDEGPEHFRHNRMRDASRLTTREIAELQAEGWSIIKLHREGSNKLTSIPFFEKHLPESVDYVLVQKYDRSPLTWDRIRYQPGGHKNYIDDFFISAPKIRSIAENGNVQFRQSRYSGDFDLASTNSKYSGQILINIFEKARNLLREGKDAELSKHINDFFPATLSENKFRSLFRGERGLNINEPFRLRRNGSNLADTYNLAERHPNFVRSSDNPHHADMGNDVAYTSKREPTLPSYTAEGTAVNPVVRTGEARLLDPLRSLNKGIHNAVNGAYMEDVKAKHVTDFMARYRSVIEVKDDAEAILNPFKYALDAPFKTGADPAIVAEAKAYRTSMKEFLGIQDKESLTMQTLYDSVSHKILNRLGEKTNDVFRSWMLHRINDPTSFMRQVAFHSSLGLFNPTTYFTQMSQFPHMLGIMQGSMGGLKGSELTMQAFSWSVLQGMSRLAGPESVVGALAKKAVHWGGTPEQFKESYEALKRSGILTVGKEHAYADDFLNQSIIRSSTGNVLDWGKTFFDKGESHARQIAWNASYLEWRNKYPKAKLNDDVIRQLVNRTDLLTGNMTRASYSNWQTGFQGITKTMTQYWNWHARLTEQMLGTRLTDAEKKAVMLTNSMLFGIPAGIAGRPSSLIPIADIVTKQLNNRGIDTDQSVVLNTMMVGLPQALMEGILGEGFNISEKFGPNGRNPFAELMFGEEKTWTALMLGSSGAVFKNAIQSIDPLWFSLRASISSGELKLTFDDFKPFLTQNIASVSILDRAIGVMAAGEYFSKKGIAVGEVDNWKGLVMGVTGLDPKAVTRTYKDSEYIKAFNDYQKRHEKEIMVQYTKYWREKDPEHSAEIIRRINTLFELGKFTPQERVAIQRRAAKGSEGLVYSTSERLRRLSPESYDRYTRRLEGNR